MINKYSSLCIHSGEWTNLKYFMFSQFASTWFSSWLSSSSPYSTSLFVYQFIRDVHCSKQCGTSSLVTSFHQFCHFGQMIENTLTNKSYMRRDLATRNMLEYKNALIRQKLLHKQGTLIWRFVPVRNPWVVFPNIRSFRSIWLGLFYNISDNGLTLSDPFNYDNTFEIGKIINVPPVSTCSFALFSVSEMWGVFQYIDWRFTSDYPFVLYWGFSEPILQALVLCLIHHLKCLLLFCSCSPCRRSS